MGGFEPMFGGGGSGKTGDPAGGSPSKGRAVGFTPMRPEKSGSAFQPLFGANRAPAPEPGPAPVDLDEALAEAKAEGVRETREAMQSELDEMRARLDALEPAFEQLEGLRTEALRQAASDVGALVVAVARRVLGQSLAIHPDALPGVIEQAMGQLPEGDDLVIRVAPDDVARVRDQLDDRFEESVLPDPNIAGGCRLETRHAAIDATVDAAVEAVEAAVRTWVETRE